MQVRDVISFSKEKYFNGAVQTEWFYDKGRVESVALSYVFHGPKYYGVAKGDINSTKHQLIDTASFTKRIADKLYLSSENNFVLTIAGYGTGKSHLAVCLGALFCGGAVLRDKITKNICAADAEIGAYIQAINTSANLVLVLNGMNNFNLDSELLKCARLALTQNGVDDSILRSLTRSYDVARHFVDRTFSIYQEAFESSARQHNVMLCGEQLKHHLLSSVESDSCSVEIINDIYTDVTGDSIHWERGISAGDVLSLLADSLCGEGKPFNKILVLFDEFGRFIEYAAANPAVAGEAALQQIFEAVQNAHDRIVFAGFIQSDLSAYLSRIEKTANIVRYVGRYESSEKWYLSSNFETILANLLKKNNAVAFDKTVGASIAKYQNYHGRIMSALSRWDRSNQKKSVWTNRALYDNVILKGCFPLHPITVWILANTSNWMQQRSTITFASEMYESISDAALEDTWLPYVYPIDIIDSGIYNEMLNSEEKGLVQSQYCMLYRDITTRIGDKLNETEQKVLKAILIVNVCRFAFLDREDAKSALSLCSNVKDSDLNGALHSLENMHGVISFDEAAKTFDLVAEASGFNEFRRIYTRYRLGVTASIEDISEGLLQELNLIKPIETAFAKDHAISSVEWQFRQVLMDSQSLDEQFLLARARELNENNNGESPRGLLIYAYCCGDSREEINRLSIVYKACHIEEKAIIILLLDDIDSEMITPLVTLKTLSKFSRADSERFSKHVSGQQKACAKKIIQAFNRLVNKRQMLSENGATTYHERRNQLCSSKFEEIFTHTPPFAFDGFEKRTSSQARKYLSNICRKLFDKSITNIQGYQALTQEEKNRVKACLSTGIRTSWQVFNDSCHLIVPQNATLKKIYDDLNANLAFDGQTSYHVLFEKYTMAPYGMNANALALFCMYFIAQKGNQLLCYYGSEKLSASHLGDKIFRQDCLNVTEIKKLRFQANPYAEIDTVTEKSKEALQCCSVSRCVTLQQELAALIQQEGTTPENQLIVADAKALLEKGIKLHKAQEDELMRLRALISEAKNEFKIQKFVRQAFQSSLSPNGLIDPDYPFVYEEDYKNQLAKCKKEIDKLLREKYLPTLARFSCAITQISSVKSLFKKISEVLQANGYNDLADATKERINEIETELLVKQKYESALVELERDLAMCENVSSYTYVDSVERISKLQNWLTFISSAQDLPQVLRKSLEERIRAGAKQLNKHIESLQETITKVFSLIDNATNLHDLMDAERQLMALNAIEPPEETRSEVFRLCKCIEATREAVESLPGQIDSLIDYRCSEQIVLASVLQIEQKLKLAELLHKQAGWIDQMIEPIESDVRKMTAESCSGWIRQTQVLPEYLSQQTIVRYQAAKKTVEQRLHNCRVQGVVSMFDELNEEEKNECLRILHTRT